MQQTCSYHPEGMDGAVSMHHCPECGEMVIAGMKHPVYTDKQTEEYWDHINKKASEEKQIVEEALSETSADFDPCVTGQREVIVLNSLEETDKLC